MRRPLLLAPLLAAVASAGGVPAFGEPPAPDRFEKIAAAGAVAVVPIRGVLKVAFALGGQSAEQEQSATIRGAVVDPSGLVAVPDVVGTITSIFKRLLPAGATFSVTPSRIRVLLGDEQKEYDAVDVVRDAESGIAWVQVVDPPGALPAVDLSGTTRLRVGQTVVAVTRMSRGFDFVPEMRILDVVRRVERPRGMWGLSTGSPMLQPLLGAGLPAYDLEGHAVGLLVTRIAEGERIDVSALRSGSAEPDLGGLFVLPLDEARKSLAEAKKRVPDAIAKAKAAAKEPEAKPPGGGDVPAGMDGDGKAPPPPATPPTPAPPGMG